MKKTLVTIGLLMFASASFGSDGQHTGVGGNPFTPPPNPSSTVLPSWSSIVQSLVTPGLMILVPSDLDSQDAADQQPASQNDKKNQKNDKAGTSSAQ
ncbi:MAG TPA: hypothetical protein VFO10_25320 [Oligoflexus sp.]|uniref:hypothetical protein n=1 Tax=Oligoflexus sp. TaxID=1971216 RepID=UPI002D7EE629|nr:hypothetical protein [Oligoflexus sp.]HET9240610.1 hypothetical protein [Oligoflexus sp.]